ncbi:cysteine hydrolase family protein [Nonomuraea thailandensis]
MTTLENRPKTALIVIDVQNGVVGQAHERDAVVANVASLVDKARVEQVPVVWVQHNDEELQRESEEWRIVPELGRSDDEPLVEKSYPDSFEDTTLESVLAGLEVGRLVVAGAQTDVCIRSTLHGALVRGTTRSSSATPTRPRTCRSGARPRPTW